MTDGSQYRIRIRQIVTDTGRLFSKSVGVLFIYTILFSLFSNFIFFPVSRKLWSLSLLTVKEGYISDQNITAIFTHPLVLLASIFIVVGYCSIFLMETTGIMMILEYTYRNQPVKLFSIVPMSFKQIKHCLLPKNWMIFVFLLVVQPLVDSNFAGQMMADFTIPEYIMDYINARLWLGVLVLIVVLVLVVYFIRYLFLPLIMLLERKNYVAAAKKSVACLKGRFISTYVKVFFVTTFCSFIFYIVPDLVLYGLQTALTGAFSKYAFAPDVSSFVFDELFVTSVETLRTIFVKIFATAMLLVIYHEYDRQLNDKVEITLPENCVKTEGKVRTFRWFAGFIYLLIFITAPALFVGLTVISESEPLIVSAMITPTKIAAHKGYSSKAPENTMPAFELATDCDIVDYIELDVRETKDGVPVVIHDASILAATGNKMLIYDINYDELQNLNATYGHTESEFQNTKISSLDEVLSKYSDKKNFIIEIKANKRTPELPRKIVDLMDKYGITETSAIHSGNYESLKAVKEINPDITCGFIIAVSTGGYADLPYADFFSVEHTYLSKNIISQIHKRGKEVYVWTVNEKSSFDKVRNMGVDAVITDYPEDAYEGIHKYDTDLMDKLNTMFDVANLNDIDNTNIQSVDYNGTGD